MAQMRIFVSHSSADNAFVGALVGQLRAAGADVWYDQNNLGPNALLDTITRELSERQVFIVVLSPSALDSAWVHQEVKWYWGLRLVDPKRLILPVTAQPIDIGVFNHHKWLMLQEFLHVEAPGGLPHPSDDTFSRILSLLSLTPKPIKPPRETESVESLLAQGRGLVAQERYDEALPLAERATKQASHNYDAWVLLSMILGSMERYEESLEASKKAIQLKPDQHWAWYNKGLALNYLRRCDEALISLDHALALDESYAPSWCERCAALDYLGRHKEALEAADRALALDPAFRLARIRKAHRLGALNRNDEALAEFDAVLASNPSDAETWHDRGRLLIDMKRHAEALASYDTALALNANDSWGWNGKGYVYLDQGDFREALRCVNKAVSLAPNDAMYWDSRGEVYMAMEAYEEALFNFDHALSLAQASQARFVWAHKAQALYAVGRYEEAEAAKRRSTENDV